MKHDEKPPPNWAMTRIDITGKKKDIREFLDKVKSKDLDFDFDKIIPSPKTKEEYLALGLKPATAEDHIQILEDRPWFNWWEFNNIYWGTKWNAKEIHIDTAEMDKVKDEEITKCCVYFETAWSNPMPIINVICNKMTDKLDLVIKMAEEQGIYGGIIRTQQGIVLEDEWYEDCDKAFDISEDVIGYSVRSIDAQLKAEETNQCGDA